MNSLSGNTLSWIETHGTQYQYTLTAIDSYILVMVALRLGPDVIMLAPEHVQLKPAVTTSNTT